MRAQALSGAVLAVALALAAPAWAQEVVAARTLRAGTILAEHDLRAAGTGAGVAGRIAELVGLETRRAIYKGRPVVQAHLGPPTLVHRNDVVVMTYTDGGLGIRTEGRALDSGGRGELVRVLNLTSRQPVRAVVAGSGRVEVRR